MDADYSIFPKRNGRSDGSSKNWAKAKFFTNYYQIEIDPKRSTLHQYSFLLPEEVPQDSHLYHKAVRNISKLLKEECGYLSHKGQMFWGTKLIKVPITPKCKF